MLTINPPDIILGVGAISEKPVIVEGEVKEQTSMHVTFSFDHRIASGALAAKFMQRLKQILEEEMS